MSSRPTVNRWVAASVCALAGAVVFQFFGNANHGYIDTNSLFWWWIFQWINPDSETQHGWLILALSVWLVVRNVRNAEGGWGRAESQSRPREDGPMEPVVGPSISSGTAPAGPTSTVCPPQLTAPLAALVLGLALHAVGFAAQQARLSIVALLVFIWGVLRLGGGRKWGRAAAFPLAFMVFAIPLNVLDSLGFWLRMWVIEASAHLAHAAHVGVVQNGTQLTAPDGRYNYDVAAACSGVRSLMALAALSLLIGYLNFHAWWRRGAVLLLCFPLVYVGNVARIASIIFAAQFGGPRWGDWAHEVMGYGIFVIVLGGVLAGVALLRRVCGADEPERSVEMSVSSVGGVPTPRGIGSTSRLRGEGTLPIGGASARAWIALVVVVLAIGEMFFLHRLTKIPERGETGIVLAVDGRNPVELPAFLDPNWVGWPSPVTAVEHQILPTDTGYSRMEYAASRDGHHVFLSIVLSGRDRTSIHRPELCLVGQGWTITGQGRHRFIYPGHAGAYFPATVLRVSRQQMTPRGPKAVAQLVVYWFVSGDAVVATHWHRIALDVWNRVFHARADRWAYVLMQADASDGDEAALVRMQSVLNGTLPTFQRVVPPST